MTPRDRIHWLFDRIILPSTQPLQARHRRRRLGRKAVSIRTFGGLATSLPVEQLETRTLLAAVVLQNFTGNSLTDVQNLGEGTFAPPDTMGSVGLNQVVEFTNG